MRKSIKIQSLIYAIAIFLGIVWVSDNIKVRQPADEVVVVVRDTIYVSNAIQTSYKDQTGPLTPAIEMLKAVRNGFAKK